MIKKILKSPYFKATLVLLGGFAIFMAILNFIIMPIYVHGKEVKVPKVEGMGVAQAMETLSDASLNSEIADTVISPKPKGTIVFQKPKVGSIVKSGRTIKLFVSNGGDSRNGVPNLIGMSLTDAKLSLRSAGLSSTESYVESSEDRDIVVNQSPKAGSSLTQGSMVTIYVSKGSGNDSEEVEIPKVTGLSLNKAKSVLDKAGFSVGDVKYQTATKSVLNNTVFDQSPSAGSKASKGSSVDLSVYKDKENLETIPADTSK